MESGWIFLWHAAHNRAAPVHGEKLSLLVIRAIIGFLYKETTLFLKDTHMRTCCCAARYRQGQAGAAQVSSAAVCWLSLSCGQGAVSIAQPEVRAVHAASCCPAPAWACSRQLLGGSLTPKRATVSWSGWGTYYCSPCAYNLNVGY